MNKEKYLVVVSGPSGTGKDTVVSRMRELHPDVEVSVSATTRAPRPGEAEGVNYYYITREEFERRIGCGEILEHTCYCTNYYGTPKSEVDRRISEGRTVVLVIEVEGAGNIKKLYPDSLTVFICPPCMEELERRLRGRGTETEEAIRKRMATAAHEMTFAGDYDKNIINDTVDQCAEELYALIRQHQQ